MTAAKVKELYHGCNRAAPKGLMKLTQRGEEWRLLGKMSAGQFKALLDSVKEQRMLYNVEALQAEVLELRAKVTTLLEQKRSLLEMRDIGPPPDDLVN